MAVMTNQSLSLVQAALHLPYNPCHWRDLDPRVCGSTWHVVHLQPVLVDVQGGWGDVEVGYLVGRGSTGSVYRATCNGQLVAVKVSFCYFSVACIWHAVPSKRTCCALPLA